MVSKTKRFFARERVDDIQGNLLTCSKVGEGFQHKRRRKGKVSFGLREGLFYAWATHKVNKGGVPGK